MPERIVVKRTRTISNSEKNEFPFNREMVYQITSRANTPEFIRNYRLNSWDLFERMQLPTISEEAWRRTNLRNMPISKFQIQTNGKLQAENLPPIPKKLLESLVGDESGGQIIFSPGSVDVKLDPILDKAGVIFTDLIHAEIQHPEVLSQVVGKIVRSEEGKFAALAAGMSQNGLLLYVPKGKRIELPFHSIFWEPGKNLALFSHIIVFLDEGSEATYVNEAASPSEHGGDSLHAGIVEIYIGKNANLRFVELQSWGDHVWNFTHERAQIEKDGSLDWIFGAVGSKLTKNFSDLDLIGQGASGRMSGFYFTNGSQHLDHDTQQNHFAPNTTSDLLFKGALKENSRSVWQGMIYVAPGAQKTDGYQANRNLILDPHSRADSIPGLEILADDVRCTHGATVGKIDKDQLFYLRSRGIPQKEAERLIVEGFFDPIMQRIPFEGVRNRFREAIHEKIGTD